MRNLFFITIFLGVILYCNNSNGEKKSTNTTSSAVKKKALLIIAPENYRDEELKNTKAELEKAKIEVTVASKKKGELKGMLGMKYSPDILISEVDVSKYDAVIFIGGSGASVYFNDKSVLDIAKKAFDAGKVIGAICIAPSILANAGVLKGKKATAFHSEKDNLTKHGAVWVGSDVVVDGKIVTANGPAAASKFGKTLASLINK